MRSWKDVGETKEVSIGRTSFRLRNADNNPPKWAQPLVRDRVEEPHFVDLPDGRFAALLPIHLKTKCLTCHGPTATIAEEVKVALSARQVFMNYHSKTRKTSMDILVIALFLLAWIVLQVWILPRFGVST